MASTARRAAHLAGYVPTTPLPKSGWASRWASERLQAQRRRQRNGVGSGNSLPDRGTARLLVAASAAAAATSTSVARPRSADVLGVVILDTGRRSPAADDLLLSVASMYGRVTRRKVVAVANTATLESAVRGCMEDGATKVMVVPYCTSLSTEPETNPAMALAEVQSHLPGIRCMMGDTIAMDQLLTEFIEGQVRIVEGQRSAVPERCFEPVQRPVSQAATSSDSLHTGSGSPWADEWQGGSSAAAAAAQQQQTVWSDAAAAAQEQAVPSSGGASSSGGSVGPSAWSDDMASVLVVDYREPSESSEAAAGSSAAAAPAAAEAARAEAVQAAPAPAEPPAWQRSGIVGSSFDMGDASSSSSSGEDDWSSQLSALSGRSGHSSQRSGSDSDSEGRGNGSGNGSAQGGNGSVEAGFGFDEQGAFVETHSRARGEQLQYDAALERRLCRMEQQLQHITTLLEAQPPAQQAQHAQQAQQAPAWQSAMFEPQQAAELVESDVEATLYSPQQLAFLARKRAAKRARTGRP